MQEYGVIVFTTKIYKLQFSPVDSSLPFALTDCPASYSAAQTHFELRSRLLPQNKATIVTCVAAHTGRAIHLTANLKSCILYIYSTNIGTEYFKHGVHSPFFSLQSAVCFIILTYLVPVLFTFYIQGVLKLKKNNSGTKSESSYKQKK